MRGKSGAEAVRRNISYETWRRFLALMFERWLATAGAAGQNVLTIAVARGIL
ncbi:hypothetical protein D3C76_1698370 [compost metagenome]